MNKRIYWPIQAVGIAPNGSNTYLPVHGVQSVSSSINFASETIQELGQSNPYEIVEDLPEVEYVFEKVLDGYPLVYHLATRGYVENSLIGRQKQRCSVALSIFGDSQSSASGVPIKETIASGLYWSSVSYTMSVDGNFTESVTLVGNSHQSKVTGFNFTGNIFDNNDRPLALVSGLGGVQRRQEFLWGTSGSRLPTEVEGINASGINVDLGEEYSCSVQSISVSVDFGRENILELGRKRPYFKYGQLPVDVTTEIEIMSKSYHSIQAREEEDNTTDQTILIKTKEGLSIDLGGKNRLTNVSSNGGGTDGSNQTITYSYRTTNTFIVTHPQDPQ